MAFKVYLYSYTNFTKRKNSLKVPLATTVKLEIECKLKTPCNLTNPIIEISQAPSAQANVKYYTYAYIPDFDRYYFIESWQMDGSVVRAWLKCDSLGSHRTAILNSSQYVLRSASAYSGFIKDTKYPIRAANPTESGYHATNPLQPPAAEPTGVFVLGIVSNTASLTGCVSYYAMSYTDMLDYMTKIFTLQTQWGGGGTDLADGLKKAITDPMQYIVSAVWLPYVVTDFTSRSLVTATSTVPTGYDTVTLTGSAYRFNDSVNIAFTNLITLTLPAHPQLASRGNYLAYEPFSRYFLSFYPFCGKIELDSTQLLGGNLYLIYTVDLRTGRGILNVTCDYTGSSYLDWRATKPIRVLEAQVGVNIPLASIHTALPSSVAEYVTNTIVAAGSDFAGTKQVAADLKEQGKAVKSNLWNTIKAGFAISSTTNPASQEAVINELTDNISSVDVKQIGEDLADIASNSLAMKSTVEMVGSQGTLSFFDRQIIVLWGEFYSVADDNLTLFGRPLCETKTLSTLSGFCMCDNPSLEGSGALLPEKIEIENLLQTGVFIE